MKHALWGLLLIGTTLLMATSASALTINSGATYVGDRDILVDSADLGNSGDAAELAWVQSILGSDYAWNLKYDTTDANWFATDEAQTYAMQFADAPAYYLIKTGTGKNDPVTGHYLFDNQESMAWAVLNLDESFGGTGFEILNIGKISHVVEFGGTPVPEPSTLFLLGSGLIGLAWFGRKRN